MAIYMGTEDARARRIAALDELAVIYAGGNRSRLIQMIADGDLCIVPATTATAANDDATAGAGLADHAITLSATDRDERI